MALVFTLFGFAAFLLAMAAIVVLPLVLSPIGFGNLTETIARIARWPVLLIVLLLGLAILYRYCPDRRAARWQWVSVGSVFATLTSFVASFLFSWYLANFANYNATYGSLGAVVVLMIWLWISTIVVLLGAELNAEIEHQTARDSTSVRRSPLASVVRSWPTPSERNKRKIGSSTSSSANPAIRSLKPIAVRQMDRQIRPDHHATAMYKSRAFAGKSAIASRYGHFRLSPSLPGMSSNRETPRCALFAPLRIMSLPHLFV